MEADHCWVGLLSRLAEWRWIQKGMDGLRVVLRRRRLEQRIVACLPRAWVCWVVWHIISVSIFWFSSCEFEDTVG